MDLVVRLLCVAATLCLLCRGNPLLRENGGIVPSVKEKDLLSLPGDQSPTVISTLRTDDKSPETDESPSPEEEDESEDDDDDDGEGEEEEDDDGEEDGEEDEYEDEGPVDFDEKNISLDAISTAVANGGSAAKRQSSSVVPCFGLWGSGPAIYDYYYGDYGDGGGSTDYGGRRKRRRRKRLRRNKKVQKVNKKKVTTTKKKT